MKISDVISSAFVDVFRHCHYICCTNILNAFYFLLLTEFTIYFSNNYKFFLNNYCINYFIILFFASIIIISLLKWMVYKSRIKSFKRYPSAVILPVNPKYLFNYLAD